MNIKNQFPLQNQPQQRSQVQFIGHNSGVQKQQQPQIIPINQQAINSLQQQVQQQLYQGSSQQISQANKAQLTQPLIQLQKQNSQGIPYVSFGDGNTSSTLQSLRSSIQMGSQQSQMTPQQPQVTYQNQFGGTIQPQFAQYQNLQYNQFSIPQSLQQQEKKAQNQSTQPLSGSFQSKSQQVLPISHLNSNLMPISLQIDNSKASSNQVQNVTKNQNQDININNYLSNRNNSLNNQGSISNLMNASLGNIHQHSQNINQQQNNLKSLNFPIKDPEKPRFLTSSSSLSSQQLISEAMPTAIFPTISSAQQISNSIKTGGSLYENSNTSRSNLQQVNYQLEQMPINSFQYKTSVNSLVSEGFQNSYSRSYSNSQIKSLKDQRNVSYTSLQRGPSAIQSSNEFSRMDSNLNLRYNQTELLKSPSQDLIVNSQSAGRGPVFSFHNSDQKDDKQGSPSDFLSPAVKELMESVRKYNQQIEEKNNRLKTSSISNSASAASHSRINEIDGKDTIYTPINLIYQKMNQLSNSVEEIGNRQTQNYNKYLTNNVSDFEDKQKSPVKDPLSLLSNPISDYSYFNTRSQSLANQLTSVGGSQKQIADLASGSNLDKISDYVPILYKQNEQASTLTTQQSADFSDTPYTSSYSSITTAPNITKSYNNVSTDLSTDIQKLINQYKNQKSNLETIHEENNPETYQTDLSQRYGNNYYWSSAEKIKETKTELSDNNLNNSKAKNTSSIDQNNHVDSYSLKSQTDVNDIIRRYSSHMDLSKNINGGSIQTYQQQNASFPVYSSIDKYTSNDSKSEYQSLNTNYLQNINSKEQLENNNIGSNILNNQPQSQLPITAINNYIGIQSVNNEQSGKNNIVEQIKEESSIIKQNIEKLQNSQQTLNSANDSLQNNNQREKSENEIKSPIRYSIKNFNIQELINLKTDQIKSQIDNLSLFPRTDEPESIQTKPKSNENPQENQIDKIQDSKNVERQEQKSQEKQINQLQDDEVIKRSKNKTDQVKQEQNIQTQDTEKSKKSKKTNEQIQPKVQDKTQSTQNSGNKKQMEDKVLEKTNIQQKQHEIKNIPNNQSSDQSVPPQQKLIEGVTLQDIESIIDRKMGQLVEKLKIKKLKRKSTENQDGQRNNYVGESSKRRKSGNSNSSNKRKSNQILSDEFVDKAVDQQNQRTRQSVTKNTSQKNQEQLIVTISNNQMYQQLKQVKSISLNDRDMNKFGPSTDSGRYPTEEEEIINLYSHKTVYNSQTSPQDQRLSINHNQLNENMNQFGNEIVGNEISPNKSINSSQKCKTELSSENQTTQQDEFYISVESEDNQDYYKSKFSEQEIIQTEESLSRKQKQKTNYTIEETKEEDIDTPGNSASKYYAKQILASSKYGTSQPKPIIKINKTIQMIGKSQKIQSYSPYKQTVKKVEKNTQRGQQVSKQTQQQQKVEKNSILKELQQSEAKPHAQQSQKNIQLQKTAKQTSQSQAAHNLREQKNVATKVQSKSQGKAGQTLIRNSSRQKMDVSSQQSNINQQNEDDQKKIERKERLQYLLNLKREKLQQQIQEIDGQITNIQPENKNTDDQIKQISATKSSQFKTPITNSPTQKPRYYSPVQKPRFSSPQPQNKTMLAKSRSQDKLTSNSSNQIKKSQQKNKNLMQTKSRGECLYEIALLQNERRKILQELQRQNENKKEREECTFSPKIKQFQYYQSPTYSFSERQEIWQRKNMSNDDLKGCTFRPELIQRIDLNKDHYYINQYNMAMQRIMNRKSVNQMNSMSPKSKLSAQMGSNIGISQTLSHSNQSTAKKQMKSTKQLNYHNIYPEKQEYKQNLSHNIQNSNYEQEGYKYQNNLKKQQIQMQQAQIQKERLLKANDPPRYQVDCGLQEYHKLISQLYPKIPTIQAERKDDIVSIEQFQIKNNYIKRHQNQYQDEEQQSNEFSYNYPEGMRIFSRSQNGMDNYNN